ncbi:MAG: Ldh family oxidoreductase [Shimia sp.]
MPLIPIPEIEATARTALEAHGARSDIAADVALAVAYAEAHGNVICGLYYLESYCLQLRSGRVRGDVDPVVTRPRPGVVIADAGLGFAQPAFAEGLWIALDAARETGTVTFSVTHSHTCTALGYFTEQLARAGVIAFGATNATAIVAPPGGATRLLGTNPLAFSVPGDAPGSLAMHMDFSTSATALGSVTQAKAAGRAIPEGWAVDAAGQPTTDPAAALDGALLSAAGAKGWGLGLMVEVLASCLTATTASRDLAPLKAPEGPPHGLGQTYLLIDPAALAPGFGARMAALAAAVEGDGDARVPGVKRAPAEAAEVPEALWRLTQSLATGTP